MSQIPTISPPSFGWLFELVLLPGGYQDDAAMGASPRQRLVEHCHAVGITPPDAGEWRGRDVHCAETRQRDRQAHYEAGRAPCLAASRRRRPPLFRCADCRAAGGRPVRVHSDRQRRQPLRAVGRSVAELAMSKTRRDDTCRRAADGAHNSGGRPGAEEKVVIRRSGAYECPTTPLRQNRRPGSDAGAPPFMAVVAKFTHAAKNDPRSMTPTPRRRQPGS